MPTVTNTDAGLEGKTLVNAESSQTITGLKTFDRDPSAPFAVSASSAVVTNLDADTVDGAHYATGNWTPVIGGSGGTSGQVYSSQSGTYVKIGREVWVNAEVVMTTKGTITGDVQIQGLPFLVGSATGDRGTFTFFWNGTNTALVYLTAISLQSSTVATLYGVGAAVTALTVLATAHLADGTGFTLSGFYRAAS